MKLRRPSRLLAFALAVLPLSLPSQAPAATYEWTFNDGTLIDAFGNGTMTPVGLTTSDFITTNGTTIPHIEGVPANLLNVPQFTSEADGFNLAFDVTGANGGSAAYINQYTFIFDLYSPGVSDWQAIFQTNPQNPVGNDADWYIAPDNALGIGATYSGANAVPQDTWNRIAFTADLALGRMTFYVNGSFVAESANDPGLFDGRWALFSNVDPGDDVRLFNEGDQSGLYTHAFYVNSIAFVDRELSSLEIADLGNPKAAGILIPEPGVGMLCALALSSLPLFRRSRQTA